MQIQSTLPMIETNGDGHSGSEGVQEQLVLFEAPAITSKEADKASFNDPAFGSNKSLPVHRWVPWIAGFSADFVKDAIDTYLNGKSGCILDPFAGVGTTLIEAAKAGHDAVGFEINPYAALVCRMKARARRMDMDKLEQALHRFQQFYQSEVDASYEPKSKPPKGFRTRETFYSPKVLRKVLAVWDFTECVTDRDVEDAFRLAFAATMIRYSNYSYEPSLGTRKGAGRENIEDYPVLQVVADKLSQIIADAKHMQEQTQAQEADMRVLEKSFFDYEKHIASESVDLLITSPPYLNNYHYIRNTRPHLYWLGFAERPKDTKPIEHANFGKYWQTTRSKDPVMLDFSLPGSDLEERLIHLRTLNPEKRVYGGGGWANYAATYFNDAYRFAEGMRYALKPGARALVVIGNSVLQGVNIPTDEYLSQIAASVGLEAVDIHIPRDERVGSSIIQSDVRVAAAKEGRKLYEAVVELRKP